MLTDLPDALIYLLKIAAFSLIIILAIVFLPVSSRVHSKLPH